MRPPRSQVSPISWRARVHRATLRLRANAAMRGIGAAKARAAAEAASANTPAAGASTEPPTGALAQWVAEWLSGKGSKAAGADGASAMPSAVPWRTTPPRPSNRGAPAACCRTAEASNAGRVCAPLQPLSSLQRWQQPGDGRSQATMQCSPLQRRSMPRRSTRPCLERAKLLAIGHHAPARCSSAVKVGSRRFAGYGDGRQHHRRHAAGRQWKRHLADAPGHQPPQTTPIATARGHGAPAAISAPGAEHRSATATAVLQARFDAESGSWPGHAKPPSAAPHGGHPARSGEAHALREADDLGDAGDKAKSIAPAFVP